jgi:hypothetical protein
MEKYPRIAYNYISADTINISADIFKEGGGIRCKIKYNDLINEDETYTK